MTPTDPALMSAETLLALYARRALSPVEALQAVMRRVAELNPWVNAFAAMNPRAVVAAGESEARWAAGRPMGPLDGVPATVKDLLNMAGFPTRRGSRATPAEPAAEDAPAVMGLKGAGAVIVGKTTTTEFGWKTPGDCPLHGITRNPWNRERTPGGSSSGAAVAAAEGAGFGGLGTDTGGSCRVPAALCGVTGLKPTARRVPLAGVVPLSPSLDSVGPLAPSVGCCAVLDAAISGDEAPAPPEPKPVSALRLGLPRGTFLTEDMDATVAAAFARALSRLAGAGARVEMLDLPELAELPAINAAGGFAASEAWAWHRRLVAEKRDLYDQRILARIMRGERMGAAEYIDLVAARARVAAAVARRTAGFDAVVCPTCPVVPPAIAEVEPEAEYNRINLLLLRNTAVGNFLDRCSISLPVHRPGEAPVGLMLTGEHMADRALLAAAAGVEAALAGG